MGTRQIHAAVLHGIGQTPRYESFPAPAAGDGEAVVTVTAAALKPSDRLMANGVHYAPTTFPQVVGLDGVGRSSTSWWRAERTPRSGSTARARSWPRSSRPGRGPEATGAPSSCPDDGG
jgi:hypothetical protein